MVANWKMHPTSFADAKKLLEGTRKAAESCAKSSVVVAPPSLYLRELVRGYRGAKMPFAIQHARAGIEGSFTGEISMSQAKEAGMSYVIVGHAERRAMGETDDDTKTQVASALSLGLIPILCIGEKMRTHSGEHLQVVRAQLRTGLADAAAKLKRVVIAYEPVWAIGAEEAMRPHDMHEMAIFIRKTIVELYGEAGLSTKILYGGSIDESNAADMLKNGDVRGFLVGRASLDARDFLGLLHAIEHA